MSQVSFQTNGPNAHGSLYWRHGTNAALVQLWAKNARDRTDFTDPYPEGARANLTVMYDGRRILQVNDYVFPSWPKFKQDIVGFAKQNVRFSSNRKRREFYVVVNVIA